jgi:hypothetical protein
MGVNVYVRHTADCLYVEKGGGYRRCKCPKWLYGDIPGRGRRSRVSAKTRSWERAEREAQALGSILTVAPLLV